MGLKRFAAATAIALVALHGAAGAETLRLSHNTGDTSTWHKGAEKFNELVEERLERLLEGEPRGEGQMPAGGNRLRDRDS